MYWESPALFLVLWIVPVIVALLVYRYRKRVKAAHQFVDSTMVARLMPIRSGPRPWIKGTLLVAGIVFLIVAAARPRFGVFFEEVSTRGADVFVLIDVSKSMLAEDVAPNRLGRAKSDIQDLLDKLVGDRIGLIAFAGAPVVLVPLTSDQGYFRTALDELNTDSAPRGGSLIGDAIRKSLEAMEEDRGRDQAIVLITDGEDHDSFPKEAAEQANDRGVKIFTVGLGDASDGTRIPLRDPSGNLRYVKDDSGQEVWSRLDERLLKEIALTTAGAYIPAGTSTYDLGRIYEDHLADLSRTEISTEKRKRYRERFQVFLFIGLSLLLGEMMTPAYRRSEP